MLVQARQLGEDAAKLASAPLWPLTDDEIVDALRAAHRLEQAAAALQARLVQQATARRLPQAQGHRNIAGWLRATLLLDPQPARQLCESASAMARPTVQQAVLDGRLDLRQAVAVAATCDAIPTDLAGLDEIGPGDIDDIVARAESTQIDMAGRLPAYQLRRVGERILAFVAPEIAERADERALAQQEARAHAHRGLTLSLPVDGLVRLSGLLGTEDAATVQAAIQPLCSPAPGDDRTPAQRRADALTEVCRLALRTGELPADGGEPPQLAVTVAYQPLTRALGAAGTDTGQRLSAETVRRIACDARVLPVVLGTAGQVLDVGRTRRLATGSLRRALAVRDRGCAFPDCDRPPRWTDAHHITPWTAGGTTDLSNLVLLCRHHHRRIHDPQSGWHIRTGSDGHPDFIPPPHLDQQRHPRRNLHHLRR
ncbi:hypothetical protein J2S43_003096 [Catenuloplanes nepalensis]|uniref:HNH nuclease domain-containing protein n=1 Tax=Catenuloplanes nepalensis TaxID=587533 RepID=A0ABT9MT74_9ACTN|nr:HNH endonuclease signature motif containing protein [Catenuloplanes nepalensis]MDP9794584.1 hypothetical protein [Catenuloplanes nepalensis]